MASVAATQSVSQLENAGEAVQQENASDSFDAAAKAALQSQQQVAQQNAGTAVRTQREPTVESVEQAAAGDNASPVAKEATATVPLSDKERGVINQLAAQYGGDWALLSDATARAVASRVTVGADGKLDTSAVIGGSAGLVSATPSLDIQSFAVGVDPVTGAVTRSEEIMLPHDGGWGTQSVPFTPPADAIIETREFAGAEGEVIRQYTYRPGAVTLAREAGREAAVADLAARGLMQVSPNANGSLAVGADGVFRSPGSIQWDDKYGLITTQAQPTPVAPRYLDAAQAAKFDLLVAQQPVSPGSSWEQMQPQVLRSMLDAATVGADGKLDISRAFGGRTGYIPMQGDPYAQSFQVMTDPETGALYRFETVPGGGGEGGDSVITKPFVMPAGGRLVTETIDLGGDNGSYTRQMFVPSEESAARAASLQRVADAMNAEGIVQVQANANGRTLSVNDSGGYRDPSKFTWDDNLGLITHNSNLYFEESGGWFDDLMDFVGDVLPVVAIGAIAWFGGAAVVGALGEGAAVGAAAGTAAGEVAAGAVAAEAAAGTVAAGATTASATASASVWATQIGTTTLGNLATNAAVNFGVSLATNGGDIEGAFRNAGIGLLTGGAGALAGGAAAGAGASAVMQDVARFGAEAVVRGAATGDMDNALLGGVASAAGAWAGDWAAGSVAEEILNGADLPDWSARVARAGTGAVVSGAVQGDIEAGFADAALTLAGAALIPDAPITDAGTTNDLGLTATQMNSVGSAVGDVARGYVTGGEQGAIGAVARLAGNALVETATRSDEATAQPVAGDSAGDTAAGDPLRDFMIEQGIIDAATGVALGAPVGDGDAQVGAAVHAAPANVDAGAIDPETSNETPPVATETQASVSSQPEVDAVAVPAIAPLPAAPTSRVAQDGDSLWRFAEGDITRIGDLILRNNLPSSTIYAGRSYDVTPMRPGELSADDLRLREQIGQAYVDRDNARLAQMAEMERLRQQQIALERQAYNDSQAVFAPPSGNGGGGPLPMEQRPMFQGFLTNDADNTFAKLAQAGGAVIGRTGVNLFGLDAVSETPRGAGETGWGIGATRYAPGEISVLGIDNYTVTSLNRAALGGTVAWLQTGDSNGLKNSLILEPKAQSLLTDTMFAVQPNGVGRPDEWFRGELAAKGLLEFGNVKEIRTDAEYAGLNKKSVVVNAMNLSLGLGGSMEIASPFPGQKVGGEFSGIVDLSFLETKQMSAGGVIWDPATGIYGGALGFETRNRVGAIATTANLGADIGLLRGKVSGQVFASVGPVLSGGATASGVWNDKTGTLTLQATAGAQFGLGAGIDLSGEIQADWAAGIARRIGSVYDATTGKAVEVYRLYLTPIQPDPARWQLPPPPMEHPPGP